MNLVETFQTLLETSEVETAVKRYVGWWNGKFSKPGEKFSAEISFDKAKRWIKVWRHILFDGEKADSQDSIFIFIDPENGDAFKPASFRAPAKGARANVLDLASMQVATGPDGIGFGSKRGYRS